MKLLSHLLLFMLPMVALSNDYWEEILRNKKGEVTFYWFPNNVDVENSKDIIDGFERDMAFAFIDYLNEKYDVKIDLIWKEANTFEEILDVVSDGKGGLFGASSISITKERSKLFNFTPPYLADLIVLVSSKNVPLANTPDEFKDILNGGTAYSIKNTTLLMGLNQLKNELDVNFDIEFVRNSGYIIDRIEKTDSSFGYLDLANFLVAIKNSSTIRRQFFYPVKLDGIAMIYPKYSDWDVPVQDYFNSNQFIEDKKRVILKYFGQDIGEVIDKVIKSAEFGPFEEIMITNREKELQYQELVRTLEREKEKNDFSNLLIIILIVVFVIVAFLLIGYRIKSKLNKVLIQQQEIIEERNEELNRLNVDKNDLINVMAHDLKSPIANIQNCADLLGENDDFSGDNKRMIDIIAISSGKIQSMITKILDVEAVESGQRNLKMEVVTPADSIQKVIDSYQEKAEEKQINIDTDLSPQLLVEVDAFYFEQVVDNLLSNALKFSTSNTTITISLKKMDEFVRLSVRDEGPGMTEEDKGKVFKKFQQLSAQPTGGEQSIGLGLSIVKSYTEMMGGLISFDSAEGVGTTFHIDLIDKS